MSILVIPMVLFTYLRAYLGDFAGHKKLAKYTFPVWLYVAVTGVVVYLMIQPYY
jgi:putative membrane protein